MKIFWFLACLLSAVPAWAQTCPSTLSACPSPTLYQPEQGGVTYLGTAPAVSACGTSPSIDSHATNFSGTVTAGSGTVTSCTVTFAASGFATWVHCRVSPESTIAAFGYSYTKTVLTVTATSLTSDVFDYACDGS
jgi:hypothetical protein